MDPTAEAHDQAQNLNILQTKPEATKEIRVTPSQDIISVNKNKGELNATPETFSSSRRGPRR